MQRILFAGALATVLVAGCGAGASHGLILDAHSRGGVVDMSGGYDLGAVERARLAMAEHCNGRFEVLQHDGDPRVPARGHHRVDFVCTRSIEVAQRSE